MAFPQKHACLPSMSTAFGKNNCPLVGKRTIEQNINLTKAKKKKKWIGPMLVWTTEQNLSTENFTFDIHNIWKSNF